MATTSQEYLAKAEKTLEQLAAATSESERQRLRRAHGAYMKLATHGAEAAERAARGPAPRIIAEKQPIRATTPSWTLR